MIVIINYGIGNLGSLLNMLKKLNIEAKISQNINDIEGADKLILPGVGSFDQGAQNLKKFELIEILNKQVIVKKTPILGICLGMQLFTKQSEEGNQCGLCWFDAITVKFRFDPQLHLKIPHMGWDSIKMSKNHQLFDNISEESMFYFVHSYHVICNDKSDVLSTTHYGYDFVSSLSKDNIIGVQFHPEKSHKYGMKVLENFSRI
jgi:imidazole glycerol-phosphate synthase subunit HisH